MDLIIFSLIGILALAFIIITIFKNEAYYFAIGGGVLFILLSVPLLANGSLDYEYCDNIILNQASVSYLNQDNETIQTIINTNKVQCSTQSYTMPGYMNEAFGLMLMLLGIGTILGIFDYMKIKREDEI